MAQVLPKIRLSTGEWVCIEDEGAHECEGQETAEYSIGDMHEMRLIRKG